MVLEKKLFLVPLFFLWPLTPTWLSIHNVALWDLLCSSDQMCSKNVKDDLFLPVAPPGLLSAYGRSKTSIFSPFRPQFVEQHDPQAWPARSHPRPSSALSNCWVFACASYFFTGTPLISVTLQVWIETTGLEFQLIKSSKVCSRPAGDFPALACLRKKKNDC